MLREDLIKWLANYDALKSKPMIQDTLDSIIDIFVSWGWESPESCEQCQQRQVDSEKMLNREATYEEKRLRGEVEYWKDKNYRLG